MTDQNGVERQRWGGPSPWANRDSRTAAQKRAEERERSQAIERVLDILAPVHQHCGRDGPGRCPIFEWPHETTPTEAEIRALAEQIVDACQRRTEPRPRRMVGRRIVEE